MLAPRDRVVVAVSGGPDSVCLLNVLREFAADLDLTLHVAHLDHKFRGDESAAEAAFVRELAEQLSLPATIEAIDVPAYCRERGLAPQAGAREVRYRFLDRVAAEAGAQRIALGHTASDQAETLVMRLLRGAGLSGLSGIPPVRDRIIRPLIDATRDEVGEYLDRLRIPFMTDSSNLSKVYTRNRIRLELMPALRALNPRADETLAATAGLLRDENDAMDEHLAKLLPRLLRQDGRAVRIPLAEFNGLQPALRRRLLRKAAALASAGPGPDFSSVRTAEAIGFAATAQTGRRMNLPGGLTLEREYDALLVRPAAAPRGFEAPLAVPDITPLPELALEAETIVLAGTASGAEHDRAGGGNYLWQAAFDYDKICLPLTLRTRRPGDRFHPAGMGGGSKKLQDYFTDAKIPRTGRDAVLVLDAGGNIAWIVGMRTDGRFLPDSGTKRMFVVRIRDRQ